MQSPTLLNSEPNPVATATTEQLRDPETKAQPTQSEPDVQDEENNSTAPVETETAITSQENGTRLQTAETPESMEVTQAVENEPAVQPPTEPSDNTEGIGTDADPKPSAPTESTPDPITNPACDGQKAKKQDKTVTDGRKYVPSKKAMVDPLKMDMSKQMIIPFPSSQLSLQCLECHIIFSDHKSKERHLKLSHPAEYEQCILRNALFACYVCDRQFTNSTELMVHQKAHTEKKPFKCPICSQAFKKSSELTFHKKIHFGKDGYACTDCGKPCKTMTLLKYHRRTHTGERPYVCKECGKRFTMSKALQKHMLAHSPEGAEGDGGDNAAKEQLKKDCGGSTKYPCSVCKATFKSTKTRLHHMKTKHNATSNALPFVKQGTPIITPISFCQPTLLTVEPNGPLQRVDGNIDTEQIRRLIESLGNVQKVNQVVILGQVPPHATPLEVQQISQLAANYNVNPLQIDLMGQEHTESKKDDLDPLNNPCVSMEHTIILEPITPDGHLETPYFSELGSHIPAESIELTLVPTEGDQAPQQHHLSTLQSDPMDQMVCQNEVVDFKENLEQTVILELTPALTPTVELEQYQTVPQNEIPTSSLVIEMEPNSDQTVDQIVIDDQETNQSVPPPMHTVELEQTHLQREQQDPPSSPCIPPGTLTHTQIESESSPKEDFDSHIQTICLKQVHPVKDKHTPQGKQDKAEHEPSEKVQANRKKGQNKKENLSGKHDPTTKGDCSSQLEAKQVPQMSGLPINVMSAQELVKVRKRKPARAFIFQGLQELVGSFHKDDFQIDAEPAKRQKKKKSHLVVKFGPQIKEKKNRKQKKPSQHCQPTQEEVIKSKTPNKNLSKKKGPLQKERKGKKDEQAAHLVSPAKIKSPSSTQNPQVQQIKEDTRKKKIKNQKIVVREDVIHTSEHKSIASPVFKKKKQAKIMHKDQPKNKKDGKLKKNLTRKEKVKNKTSPASADILEPHIVQDSLLLLKGHKQPQLKVYKLDPSTASSQPQEDTTLESQTISDTKHPTSESTNNIRTEGKKKGGRLQKNPKALSLLPKLQVSHQPTETMLTKPKTSRKRKSSSKVETEGVITSSHSKRALECKDCGERFSEVSSLQKHKATVHITESPGLTYTNGNIFEGVSRLDLFQLPKQNDEVVGTMSAVADWDTEPEIVEMALEDRDRKLSFPSLIPSPSLPVPPSDFEMSAYENNGGSKIFAEDLSLTPAAVHSPSDQTKICESPINFTSDSPFSIAIQTKSSETAESLESAEDKQKEQNPKDPRSESEVQVTTDEDIKEDFLLEVDLVTVGEQNERDDATYHEDTGAQNESNSNCNSEGKSPGKYPGKASHETTEKSLSSQTVSCSTHQMEIKEEEEEMLVQKKKGEKGAVAKNATRGRKRGTGHLKRDVISKRVSVGDTATGTESEKDQDDCQVVYEKHPVTLDSEMINESETGAKTSKAQTSSDIEATQSTAPPMPLPSISSILEESHEEQVVFELESVSTSVEEETNGGLQGGECDRDKSPAIILEKFLTSRPRATGDKELCLMKARNNQRQGLDSIAESEVQVLWSPEIKVEENISDPPLIAPICQNRQRVSLQPQHHRDIRTVLVKEESSFVLHEAQTTQGSRHIRWNVEQVNIENTSSPLMESEEATMDCSITPEFNTSQCIFYPVKEEEREVDLGAAQTNSEALTTGPSSDAQQMELQATDSHFTGEVSHSAPEYQEIGVRGLLTEPGVSDFADGHAEADTEPPADLRDFLLQSSDEEDVGAFELSEPQLDSEAEVMAAFYKNPTNSARQPDENLPTSTSQLQAPREDSKTSKEPIDFFCQYFGWDTWVDIANCTNTLSNMPNPVTAKEVAQFVGIHVAMGTLKFPSSRLYWENLTKVPLVAEAMPLSRFLQLSRMLKLASPAKDPAGSSVWEERDSADFHNVQQGETISNRQSKIPPCRDVQKQGDAPDDANSSKTQTDPLWKAEPLLCRFKAGCQSLRRDSDYAVDQYPLPLTGKMHNKKMSLHCTTLIGFGGLLLHVDLKSGLSGKEDAVEKMVPKGSMVFLCKQELSTPAMLERLLAAGVHGAGRVGGARGQIGDEFVSSDGKLMLRRSHCGFILSTAGNGQRNMASLIDHFEKAQRSAHLNRDLQKLYSIPLTASAPTCWPQAVLWYLTDLALVNSWLLYRQNQRAASAPLTLMAFRLEVSKALILSSGSDTQDSVPPQPPMEKAHSSNETPSPSLLEVSPLPDAATRYDASGHWPEQLGEGEGGRCRYGDCQRTSRVLCLKCCVFLCISRNHNCFLNFHNQGNLGKK